MDSKQMSDKVEAALNRVLPHLDGHSDGDLLVEWVVVAYVANPDKEEGSGYPMLYSNGTMPTYRVRGLLSTAMIHLNDAEE